jgi:uncharacterized protein
MRETLMRPLPNETDTLAERRCILSGEHGTRAGLIRLALGPDGSVAPDVRARAPGRGAWIGVDRAALETALTKGKLKGALARAFKTSEMTIAPDLPARVEAALERNALDRLGLEARSGTLLTGSEKIVQAARAGQVKMLLHAGDASADGNGKLDQAWRVGSDAEGSGKTGLVLSVDRAILSQALGRENCVHIAIINAQAAARVGEALNKWHSFIGRAASVVPCESDSQGSSALSDVVGADIEDEGF